MSYFCLIISELRLPLSTLTRTRNRPCCVCWFLWRVCLLNRDTCQMLGPAMTIGCSINRITIYFIFQTRAHLRLKGVIMNNYTRTTGINQDCPGMYGSPVNKSLRTQPKSFIQQSFFNCLSAELCIRCWRF